MDEERDDRHLGGSGGKLASSTMRGVEPGALMGAVLGSGNWSRDSRGTRDSAAEEADIE